MIVSDTIWTPDLSSAGKSKYKALAQAIRDAIMSGELSAGQQLPPMRELGYRIGLTPGTVARAYAILTEEGRLEAQVGRGTFVAGKIVRPPVNPDSLIYLVDEGFADFRSSRVPDVGQGRIIDDALIELGQSHCRRHINYPTAQTDYGAREAVAGWIDAIRVGYVTADDVVLGNGAQNCCVLALQAVLHGAAPVILTEELSYPGVRHAGQLLRAKVVGVAMDDEGIIPEALEAAYRNHGGQVLLTAAEVHSPTTIKTTLVRKQALAKLAEKLDIMVIEDDCHTPLATEVPSYRVLTGGNAYYISSLTKTVSGALRFGYMVGPQGQQDNLRQVAQSSFYGVSQPITDLCEGLIRSGAAHQIRKDVFAATAQRVRLAVNALGAWDIRWREDAPFIWLQMPTGWRASSFSMACEKQGIKVRPADEFALSDAKTPNAVRLALNTCVDEQVFRDALAKMNLLLANPARLIDG
ncbi:MAG: PLP-dependent aminotransferase family protein [Yoonia sp.]